MNKVYFCDKEHRYFLDEAMTKEVPGVSYLLEHFGYSNYEELRNKGLGPTLDKAADYGDKVHETLRLYDEGTLQSFDEKILGEVKAWQKYLKDYYHPDFLLIEEPLVSSVWGFAGTPDRYFIDNLPDIKTGQKTVAHAIQTAFYKVLIEENFPFKVKNRFTVEVKPDGYKIIPHKNRNDENIAKALCQIWHDKKSRGLL